MQYKNDRNRFAYENSGEYSKAEYVSHLDFLAYRDTIKKERLKGHLREAYTCEELAKDASVDIDHILATKTIHDGRGRRIYETYRIIGC